VGRPRRKTELSTEAGLSVPVPPWLRQRSTAVGDAEEVRSPSQNPRQMALSSGGESAPLIRVCS
jgi:hypothetical protein